MLPRSVVLLCASVLLFASCSINRFATRVVSDAITGDASTVFTSDDDPELVGDAMPFALKMFEVLLRQAPDDEDLIVTAGSSYIMYANAFLQTPALMLPADEFDRAKELEARAKHLYLRGRDILIAGADRIHPGFRDAIEKNAVGPFVAKMQASDVPLLYWTAVGWVAAYSLDTVDFSLGVTIGTARQLMDRAAELDPDFDRGAIHEFYELYYGSLPAGLGGDRERARAELALAIRDSDGKLASPYVSFARSVSIASQNYDEFVQMMKTALQVDPDGLPDYRLQNILAERLAQWYLDHAGEFFINTTPDP